MKKFLLAVILLSSAWAVWSNYTAVEESLPEPVPESPTVTRLNLYEDVVVTPQPAPAVSGGQAEVAEASAGSPARVGILALDKWHRSTAASWDSTAVSPAVSDALSDFFSMRTNGAGTYSALLRESLPGVLGADFDSFANVWSTGGTVALSKALDDAAHLTPAWMAWCDALVFQLYADRDFLGAGNWLGRGIRQMLEAGYGRARIWEFRDMANELRDCASDCLPFEEYIVQSGDSLDAICRRFAKQGMALSYGWINSFNGKPIFNTNLRLEQKLKLPAQALHLEAWRGERLLLLYAGDDYLVGAYQASFGKEGNATPLGEFTLGDFLREPVFWQQGGDPVPFGNPENPLGTRWMGFSENTDYGIHGNTDADETIGSFESLGCIRMHNSEVEELFELLPRGGKVIVRN